MAIQSISSTAVPIPPEPRGVAASQRSVARDSGQSPTTTNSSVSTVGDTGQTAESVSATKAPDRETLRAAAEKANQTIQSLTSNLKFTVDDQTGIGIVKVVDTETKETIRQIPSEEMLSIARRLEELKGLLIKQQA